MRQAVRSLRRYLGGLRAWMRPLAVFVAAWGILEAIEAYYRRHAIEGMYFQVWSSEKLMQSVSLRELRSAPLQSLWYLHIQPPVTNLIRAVIAAFHHQSGTELIRGVDRDLYHVWAAAAAVLCALLYDWFRRLRVPGVLAGILSLVWLLHPANLAFATLMDGTLVSSLLTTWILYETWRLGGPQGGSVGRLAAAVLLAYFTRSVFQWPFMLVILMSVLLVVASGRRRLMFALVIGLTVGLYSIKQASLFGTTSTSTFQGTNLTRSIDAHCALPNEAQAVAGRERWTAPVLTRRYKLDGSVNFNHFERLDVERALIGCYRREMAHRSVASLWAAYTSNLEIFLRPSSQYTPNVIVARIPWRRAFDRLFSDWSLVWATLAAAALGIWRARGRQPAALALPAMYVFAIGVVGERGENMRFKFFLEPAFFVLVASQLYRALHDAAAAARAVLVRRRARTASLG